jgi:hypothetical protein
MRKKIYNNGLAYFGLSTMTERLDGTTLFEKYFGRFSISEFRHSLRAAMTFSITTLSIMALSLTTLSISTLSSMPIYM